ncbi:hypothetical protein AAC387_Pa07g1380 [Persea americana]
MVVKLEDGGVALGESGALVAKGQAKLAMEFSRVVKPEDVVGGWGPWCGQGIERRHLPGPSFFEVVEVLG